MLLLASTCASASEEVSDIFIAGSNLNQAMHGDRVVARLAPRIEALEELLVSELDEDEREQFADYLRRSRHAMRQAGNRV